MDWSKFPPTINQPGLAHWAEQHAQFTTAAGWQSTLDTCIVQSKAPRYDRGKGGPRDGAENRVLFQIRPQQMAFEEWKPVFHFINIVMIPAENGEGARGQGLLPAERALWD